MSGGSVLIALSGTSVSRDSKCLQSLEEASKGLSGEKEKIYIVYFRERLVRGEYYKSMIF